MRQGGIEMRLMAGVPISVSSVGTSTLENYGKTKLGSNQQKK